jgi:hypothetical protein
MRLGPVHLEVAPDRLDDVVHQVAKECLEGQGYSAIPASRMSQGRKSFSAASQEAQIISRIPAVKPEPDNAGCGPRNQRYLCERSFRRPFTF